MGKERKNIKIALVGYKLSEGGLEHVFGTVSELLYHANYEVHVIVLENKIEFPYHGTLLNLGCYSKFKKYFQLKQYLVRNNFDYIIDFRHRINPWMEILFIYYIFAGFKFIYTVHSSRLEIYLTSRSWVARKILNKAFKIVAVSRALNEKIKLKYGFNKAVTIPNSVAEKATEFDYLNSLLPFKYCIAVGRLVNLKQFDKMIAAYHESILPKSEIHLVILGQGEEKENLLQQIENLNLTKYVHLLGFKNDAYFYIKDAQFLVLSSKYEGFSMVILEALNAGIPVVSFDCETGPSELVTHEYNGLLVENQNFIALKESLNRMVENPALYDYCKKNAKESVSKFSNEKVAKKWIDLLN